MIIATSNKEGTLLNGTVVKWKTGIGKDSENLTVLTLLSEGISYKVLCWNKGNHTLSTKARKLQVGEEISIQGVFDFVNPFVLIASKLKKNGIYRVNRSFFAYGTVSKCVRTKDGFFAFLPMYEHTLGGNILCLFQIPEEQANLTIGTRCFISFHKCHHTEINGLPVFLLEGQNVTIGA